MRKRAYGTFCEDLFYCIYVVPVSLSPLRERKDDIPLLSIHFIKKFCGALKKDIQEFTPAAIQRMMLYNWPGKVRELQNKIEDAKERFELEYLENLLKISNGNISHAFKMVRRYRVDIYKLIKKYRINFDNS